MELLRTREKGSMEALRKRGWEHFDLVRNLGLPFATGWTPETNTYKERPPSPPVRAWNVAEAEELEGRPEVAGGTIRESAKRPVLESTFFNKIAYDDIHNPQFPLYKPGTAKLLKETLNRREINEFRPGAMVIKTFWRPLPETGSINVGIWQWPTTPGKETLDKVDDERNWPSVCVEKDPAATSSCLRADQFFHTAAVSNRDLFQCEGGCSNLANGQTLILLGLHVASKETPDWLWATFWWKGRNRTHGDSWTCDDAQQALVIPRIDGPWSNYSMDVTDSFALEKPAVKPEEKLVCGAPNQIVTAGGRTTGEETLAAYNPFVEGVIERGRKSNCLVCHAGANTKQVSPRRNFVPVVDDLYWPRLAELEGHIRTDYLWTIRDYIDKTAEPR